MEITINKQHITYYKEAAQKTIENLRNEYARSNIDPKTNRLECMNVTLDVANKKLDKLSEIVEKIDEEQLNKMLDYLPYKKNGKIETKAIPIYNTGIRFTEMGEGYYVPYEVAIILEAKFEYDYTSYLPRRVITENEYEMKLVTDAKFDTKDIALIDDDFNFTKLEVKQRNSYIKIEDLVPGKSYLDKKDNEYLYVGALEIHEKFTTCKNIKMEYTNVFLRLTNKTKKELQKCSHFGEYLSIFLTQHFNKKCKYADRKNLDFHGEGFKISKSFKVVSESETIVDLENMFCKVKSGYNDNRFFGGNLDLEVSVPNKELERVNDDIKYKKDNQYKKYKMKSFGFDEIQDDLER